MCLLLLRSGCLPLELPLKIYCMFRFAYIHNHTFQVYRVLLQWAAGYLGVVVCFSHPYRLTVPLSCDLVGINLKDDTFFHDTAQLLSVYTTSVLTKA